jgi:hypothetical protein
MRESEQWQVFGDWRLVTRDWWNTAPNTGVERQGNGFLVNNSRPPPPLFLKSIDFKGTLSCFRINTFGSGDSKGG